MNDEVDDDGYDVDVGDSFQLYYHVTLSLSHRVHSRWIKTSL